MGSKQAALQAFKTLTPKLQSLEAVRGHFQSFGHLLCNINPLERPRVAENAVVIPDGLRFPVQIGTRSAHNSHELQKLLHNIYCSNIGYEISHLPPEELAWITERIEETAGLNLADAIRRRVAKVLLESEGFDAFMQKRFNQVKRYGLEGCETTAVAMDILINIARDIEHMIVAMPHRGRLNLMVGQMGYAPEAIFKKLAGESELPANIPGSADVLSHLCLQNNVSIAGKPGKITLLPNPSHLEAINSVALGTVYAYQKYAEPGKKALSVQIHGDAAFSAQGVVMESLSLSQLPNFCVGGTIHILSNNQLGFTTEANHGRSSLYASDVAKFIGAPVIHVNGDDPEAVVKATNLAFQYRTAFGKDVVLDIVGWRKMGHNELDEPEFTQPLMYKAIKAKSSTASSYAAKVLDAEAINAIRKEHDAMLETCMKRAEAYKQKLIPIQETWKLDYQIQNMTENISTGVDEKMLRGIAEESVNIPAGFKVHPRLLKHHIEARQEALRANKIDWATAEAMALGSLLSEGHHVRLSGQDVGRGTFSHRHFQFSDQETGDKLEPLNQGKYLGHVEIVPSNLSEFGVLGFEYGLSLAAGPKVLPIWEAQFGDFFNGAQVIIDAFISSGETKWGLQSPLTILLPHGYDGAGPEHSSCRLERFLQMTNESLAKDKKIAASDPPGVNMIVATPTTPSNYFHLLRRQMKSAFRKPLIIASPKVLLRLPAAVSTLSEFGVKESFKPVIVDPIDNAKKIKEVIFVSGKIYYDAKKEANAHKRDDVLFVRLEQLCPFPFEGISGHLPLAGFLKDPSVHVTWLQEEPQNMGAYQYVEPRIRSLLPGKVITYAGRSASAAPAAGVSRQHKLEVSQIMNHFLQSK